MKIVSRQTRYVFDSFTEIVKFLTEDYKGKRTVKYGPSEEFYVPEGCTCDMPASQRVMYADYSRDAEWPEMESLEEYFDSEGKPLDDKFNARYPLRFIEGYEELEAME